MSGLDCGMFGPFAVCQNGTYRKTYRNESRVLLGGSQRLRYVRYVFPISYAYVKNRFFIFKRDSGKHTATTRTYRATQKSLRFSVEPRAVCGLRHTARHTATRSFGFAARSPQSPAARIAAPRRPAFWSRPQIDQYMEIPYTHAVSEQNPSDGSTRPRGRPPRPDAPIVPWDEVDRLLVFGEKVKDEATGRESVSFPSYTELAGRYGVSKSRIGQYATRSKCLRRREEAKLREQARYEQKVTERRAEARALGTSDVVQIIDGYIEGFRSAVDEGKVRFDSPADLDRLVRLKELMLGNADSRQEIQGGLTLDAIQQRHHRLRTQIEGMTGELAGVSEEGMGDDGAVH